MSNTDEEIEKLAFNNYFIKTGEIIAESSRPDLVIGFIHGYKAAFQQNKVSDSYFKDAFLVKCDRLLRDKGNSSKETNECISMAFDDTIKEYASIVNERKDNVNDAIEFAEWLSGEGYVQYDGKDRWIAAQNNLNVYYTEYLYKIFKSESQPQKEEVNEDELWNTVWDIAVEEVHISTFIEKCKELCSITRK